MKSLSDVFKLTILNTKLSRKVLLWVLVSGLIPMVVFIVPFYYDIEQTMEERALTQLEDYLSLTSGRIFQTLRSAENEIEYYKTLPLRSIPTRSPTFKHLYTVELTMERLNASSMPWDNLSRDAFNNLKQGNTILSPPYFTQKLATVSVLTPYGQNQVLIGQLRTKALWQSINRGFLRNSLTVVVANASGTIIYSSNPKDFDLFTSINKTIPVNMTKAGFQKGIIGMDSGAEHLWGSKSLYLKARFGSGKWRIFMLEPMSVVHSLPNKLLTSWGFYLVLSLLILLFLALRSARQLITPIQYLTEATKNLTQGELEQNVSVNTNDELETLAESFNEMTENLRLTIEEKDTLLKELHHRVKNNMQVVTSLLRLQSKQIDNPEVQEIFSKSRQRINSMALVHEQLYQSDTMTEIDVETYLNELVRGIKHGYLGERTISIECQVEEGITLDMDRTIHCGLIISELTLNALQHAFTEADTNSKITISFSQSEDHFVLTIGDNGSGLPDDFEIDNPSSLGMNLVHRLATKQLRGDLTFKTDNETVFTVEFPKNPTYTNSNPTGND